MNREIKATYYTPLPDEIFTELKTKAIELWDTMDNGYGYTAEKIEKINSLKNIKDNGMTIIAMFDVMNIRKLANLLSERAKNHIMVRLNDVDSFTISALFI